MPIIRLGRITETPVARTATTSTKLAPRVSRPRRRCRVAFRIINAATSSGTGSQPVPHFPGPIVPASGRSFVRHEPNLLSGGRATDTDVEEFLNRTGSSPENLALRALLDKKTRSDGS